ncbi:procathepsin L-like [Chironomus tepperi]|uniref:procathepsin L-like n=1 Tax=Chironomus tepperi TaxID=113505 RepID=UPI00391F1A2A
MERYTNFVKHYNIILEQNKKFDDNKSYFRMGLNRRSADTPQEKLSWHGLKICKSTLSRRALQPTFGPAPIKLDYRTKGFVTNVKDQGDCGCCFAFASMCALEGQMAKKYRKLVSLSEQNILDCTYNNVSGNWGCDGGFAEQTFQYVLTNKGVDSSISYPYEGILKTCRYNPQNKAGNVTGYQKIQGDEEVLKRVLAGVGPLVIGIKADMDTFYGYSNGIYDDLSCYGYVNHAVALVGYGTDNSTGKSVDYWIVKNSWSDSWGEGGYIRMIRGVNICNITSYVVYPIV